jgi:hypothetical protein
MVDQLRATGNGEFQEDAWGLLNPSERTNVEVVIKCVCDTNYDLRPPYKNLYNAILGSHGARDMFAHTAANAKYLSGRGKCLFFAAATVKNDEVFATDGVLIFRMLRSAIGGGSLKSIGVEQLQQLCTSHARFMNLEDFAVMHNKRHR